MYVTWPMPAPAEDADQPTSIDVPLEYRARADMVGTLGALASWRE